MQKQNQSAQGNQFAEEFASETDAQEVRRRNKQSEQKSKIVMMRPVVRTSAAGFLNILVVSVTFIVS